MERVRARPYVSCAEGFHFKPSLEGNQQRLKVTVSGIIFRGTPLTFEDCSHVELLNCSHQNAKTAVSVLISRTSSIHFKLQGPSFFQNNSQCLKVMMFHKTNSLTMNINKVEFRSNGLTGREFLTTSLITIATHRKKSSRYAYLYASFYNITCAGNRVPFINTDLPSGATKEIYSNVKVVNNNIRTQTNDDRIMKRHSPDSMFTFRTKRSQITIKELHCAENRNSQSLRCIKVQSFDAKINVANSVFLGHSVLKDRGAALYVETEQRASLEVFNTTFERNRANIGGALFTSSKGGSLKLNLTNINFTRCESINGGAAVVVGKLPGRRARSVAYHLRAYLTKVQVTFCASLNTVSHRRGCGSVCIMLKSGEVSLKESMWIKNTQARGGALFVGRTGGKANVEISESVFVSNHNIKGGVVNIAGLSKHAGSVTVSNTKMIKNEECALEISSGYTIKMINVTITSCKNGLQVVSTRQSTQAVPVGIFVTNSMFKGNIYDALFDVREPKLIRLTIANTIFTADEKTGTNGSAIRFFSSAQRSSVRSPRIIIELNKVTFDSRPSSSFFFHFKGKKQLSLTIRRSTFRNCISLHRQQWNFGKKSKFAYETATGAISLLMKPDRPYHSGCIQSRVHNNTHPVWRYDSRVIFKDTLFQGNAGLIAGAVYISNGNTIFDNCTFENNFGFQNSGQVYSAYGTGRVEFNKCSFSSTQKEIVINRVIFQATTFFYSDSGGPIKIQNTSMVSAIARRSSHPVLKISNGGYVHIDQRSIIQCSQGSRLLFENDSHFMYTEKNKRFCRVNVTVLRYTCSLCSTGFYSLKTGTSHGLIVDSGFDCLSCPFGASCDQDNIAAKPNFWGYRNPSNPSSLNFIPCPENYCQSPKPGSTDYNSCHGNRTGDLCGKCAKGFTETLLSADCVKATDCFNYWLWILMVVFMTLLTLYLLRKPPIVRFLRNKIFWFKKKERNQAGEDLEYEKELPDLGYVKIIFYYYQAAELLSDSSLERLIQEIPSVSVVVAAFNFQVIGTSSGIGSLCPFAGLSAVTKELLLPFVVFLAMGNVFVVYFIHFVTNLLRKRQKPHLIGYLTASLEIMLLGYVRLAETALKLMRCVSIGSEMRLFVDGNIQCWEWWQYILLAYIVGFIIPFIAVLYLGSSRLYRASVSKSFLAACVFPLPFVIYWLWKDAFTRTTADEATVREVDNKAILKIMHQPFRPPNEKDKGTLYWESVLIGRRFIILTLHSFIPNSMLRFICLAVACEIITIHHLLKCPYRDSSTNKLEALSLITLAILAIINVAKATMAFSGINAEGPNEVYFEGMQWFQVFALGVVPALFFILAALASLSQLVRLMMLMMKCGVMCVRHVTAFYWAPDEIRRPLLAVT